MIHRSFVSLKCVPIYLNMCAVFIIILINNCILYDMLAFRNDKVYFIYSSNFLVLKMSHFYKLTFMFLHLKALKF